jgi:hypothetical protein
MIFCVKPLWGKTKRRTQKTIIPELKMLKIVSYGIYLTKNKTIFLDGFPILGFSL